MYVCARVVCVKARRCEDQQRALMETSWVLTLEWLVLWILELGGLPGLTHRVWARWEGSQQKAPRGRGNRLSIMMSPSARVRVSFLVKLS